MNIAISAVGLHPTTELCLEAMQWLHQRRAIHNVLDMGSGSGILSVTAASIWPAKVLAVDISENAVRDTRNMAESHGLSEYIEVIRSDAFANPLILDKSPYDLICFNMLAEAVIKTAAHVNACLAPDGVLIMSGILVWQMPDVEAIYNSLGFEFINEYDKNPWHAYVTCHKTETGFF